ncbi:uncharacterized protein LOC100892869 [Strongylocentrotus purpuratus]|uniref:Uncharacterized protein n=2 Tax=Strongylocentrotus purpuratus TaxID=7668 RepID=A0A7M7P2P2_STRPU|nr:uncharacterized protein LOC100892869 [Strongylocentrotus purpuratus]
MKAFLTVLATTLLVAIVSGQNTTPPEMEDEPFVNPGEIVPGLTIPYLINAAGGIWQQDRVIDSMAYACREVLPYIGSVIPEVDQRSLYWGPVCDDVIEASDDLDAFDATGWCDDDIIPMIMITNLTSQGSDGRYRRQAGPTTEYPESMDNPLDIIEILTNITRDLYGIDINMIINDPSTINTICTNVKENFLRPSLQDLTSQFAAELLSALLPRAAPLCQDWDGFLQDFGINSASPEYPLIQDFARIGSQAMGYDNREEICQAITQTLSVQGDNGEARRSFSTDLILSLLEIPTNSARCSMLANGIVYDVIEPVINIGDEIMITDEQLYQYTGFQRPNPLDSLCIFVENAFTTVVDLPDPVPFRFIPDTNLTVEFFINAAGGVWIQERTIDSLAFGCTEFLPDLESMIPDFRTFSAFYEPVCREVLVAANDLAVFDAESSCTDLTAVFTDLISTDDGYRKRRQADMAEEDMFDFIGILSNTTKDLYGLNISDQSTVCPNIKQFLEPSLPEVATRFLTELTSAVLPQAAPYFCEDWEQFLSSVGISKTSPHYPIIYDLADIGSQMLGHDSRDAICEAIQQALSYGRADRKALGRDALESFLDIFTDVERCMMIGNDAIDDIIEPLFGIDVPGFEVTSYLISRYTGYNGVKDICNALETAFTVLSGSTLTLTITGETLNGEELMYTTDLTNMASPAFKKLETIYCGVATNHLERELGSDLRRLDCVANSFNPGSIVAELEIQVFATTQDVADSLAEDVAELSTGEGLVLSSDGDSMSVSSFSATPNSATTNGGRGLLTGAIIGIAVGVVIVDVVVL